MMRSLKLTPRQILIVLHDLLATAAAIVVTFFMRFEGAALNERLHALVLFLPCFLAYALIVYFIVGLQRNKWRFTWSPTSTTSFGRRRCLPFHSLHLITF